MSAVLMHEGRNQADGRTVPAEILPETAAYFGTYTIDEANYRVVHRVVGSIRLNEAGAIERGYEFRGDALVLTARATRNESPVTYVLMWKRLGVPR